MKNFKINNFLITRYRQSISILKNYRKIREFKRYRYLFDTIKKMKCRRIMEIGTWNGEHAKQMIEVAKRYHGYKVEYYGFDLFELFDKGISPSEYAKVPLPEADVRNKLIQTGAKIRLFKGDTKMTLPKVLNILPKMDLIFIDGGHSIDTIKKDWENAHKLMHEKTVVLFDDYWNIDNAGCKQVIQSIDTNKYAVKILRIQDRFKKVWGIFKINMVKVTMK